MNIKIIEDIDYSSAGVGAPTTGKEPESHRKLDLYLPESEEPVSPILVIHGGGWFSGSRKDPRERSIAMDLSSAGFATASVDYALVDIDAPESSSGLWPAMLTDCKMAVSYLRRRADRYHLEPKRIGAIGGSSGAHLAAMLGVTGADDGFDPAAGADCSVQAVCYLYGVCDIPRWIDGASEHRLGMDAAVMMLGGTPAEIPEVYAAASPVNYLSENSAPMLLAHGIADEIISYTDTEYFHERAKAAGVDSELTLVPGAGHSFDLRVPNADLRERVGEFFRKHLSRERDH